MIETQTRVIGSANYEVTQLKASKGLKMLTAVSKILGPALAQLAGDNAGSKDLMEMSIDSESFGAAARALAGNLDTDEVERIVKQLSEVTRVDPEGGEKFIPLNSVYELHFRGKMKQLLSWLKFALEVQFADFFE